MVVKVCTSLAPTLLTLGMIATDKGLAEDFAMPGFGRAAGPRRATFQPRDQTVIQFARI
jgi:hypothetical protein